MPEPLRLFCADQSLRRPGFAVLYCEAGTVSLIRLFHLEYRNSKACHGGLLAGIYDSILSSCDETMIFVRERAFSRFPTETQIQNKVVGVSDMAVWKKTGKSFFELAPSAVKKLLTGSGKASKTDVAAALRLYLGQQHYVVDDESDAAAIGIAWLLREGIIQNKLLKEA